jgi:hypothetical protein
MQKLNLPSFQFRTAVKHQQLFIFDEFRKKWVVCTPEEWVRQHIAKYLCEVKDYPKSRLSIEKKIDIGGAPQRFDLLVYGKNAEPLLVAELKAPTIPIGQAAFDQAIRYNSSLLAPYLLISNGMSHYICHINFAENFWEYLSEIPAYLDL